MSLTPDERTTLMGIQLWYAGGDFAMTRVGAKQLVRAPARVAGKRLLIRRPDRAFCFWRESSGTRRYLKPRGRDWFPGRIHYSR
jgi:hypothetical protein